LQKEAASLRAQAEERTAAQQAEIRRRERRWQAERHELLLKVELEETKARQAEELKQELDRMDSEQSTASQDDRDKAAKTPLDALREQHKAELERLESAY